MYCLLKINLTTIQTYVWSSSICCPQHSSPFADSPLHIPLCRFLFADSSLQIPLCRFPIADSPIASAFAQIAIVSALAQSAIVLAFAQICPGAFAIVSFFTRSPVYTFTQLCLVQSSLRSCYLAKLRSTLVPSLLQDCCLAFSQSTLGQSPLHDQPSTIWQSTFGQRSSHDLPLTLRQVTLKQLVIAQLAPDQSALCLSIFPTSNARLSFVLSRWAFLFALEVVVIDDQLTTLKAALLFQI